MKKIVRPLHSKELDSGISINQTGFKRQLQAQDAVSTLQGSKSPVVGHTFAAE